MDFADLKTEILRALADGGSGDGIMHDGRVIAVKTSPSKDNGSAIVIGTAALPPGYSTPTHSHASEEVAVFLSGSGGVDIDGIVFPVSEGTVLVTPANSTHTTFSDNAGPLVVLWFYAPPGSEERWLQPPDQE
jgi:mannose-6-phosphate isomerase-like protein (cupin superfamily)